MKNSAIAPPSECGIFFAPDQDKIDNHPRMDYIIFG